MKAGRGERARCVLKSARLYAKYDDLDSYQYSISDIHLSYRFCKQARNGCANSHRIQLIRAILIFLIREQLFTSMSCPILYILRPIHIFGIFTIAREGGVTLAERRVRFSEILFPSAKRSDADTS